MKVITARISSKNQIVIPKDVRETLGLTPNSDVLFVLDGDRVALRPRPASFTDTLRGLHSDLWPDPDAWLEADRAAWE